MTTAVHLWRFYFRYRTSDPGRLTEVSRLNWQACNRAIQRFDEKQIEVLEKYYLTNYGGYEDFKAIKEYAEQNGIDAGALWNTVKEANYEVIVERGLMDRREKLGGDVVDGKERVYIRHKENDANKEKVYIRCKGGDMNG